MISTDITYPKDPLTESDHRIPDLDFIPDPSIPQERRDGYIAGINIGSDVINIGSCHTSDESDTHIGISRYLPKNLLWCGRHSTTFDIVDGCKMCISDRTSSEFIKKLCTSSVSGGNR